MSPTTKQDEVNSNKTVKRKKKRSTMQMAKKYARRSERAHGSELDSETYKYMVRILEISNHEFPSITEKQKFVNNVYEETIGMEMQYAQNQVGSRVLDSLMEYADYKVIRRIVDALTPFLRQICCDRFGSHVLQQLIRICAQRGNRHLLSADKSASESPTFFVDVHPDEVLEYNNVAMKLSRYLINNFEEFVWDTYANHVLRSVIETLGGVLDRNKDPGSRKETPDFEKRRPVGEEYALLLQDACTRFLKWPQLPALGQDELKSGLLQTILYTLKGVNSKLNTAIIKRIITEFFTENADRDLPAIFHAESSVRLLEACVDVAKPKMYLKIYRRFFAGHLKKLTLMSGANFAVQRLVNSCDSKELMEEIFDELTEHFGAVLDCKNTGVLSSLANGCLRLQCKQGPFVNSITKALGCDESPEAQLEIVRVVGTLQKYEKVLESRKAETAKLPIHLHGSIILQAMLRFNKPIKIVHSILALDENELVALFSDPKGSRILDAFMDSKFVGEKNREKLTKKLQGHWVNMASSTHGSRCLDKIWQWSKTNQRHWIMDELASVGKSLVSTKTGRIISAKLNVPLYACNKKDWCQMVGKEEKTKALFSGIVAVAAKTPNEHVIESGNVCDGSGE